ncbi:MAG: hypothetical protein ACFB6S_10435 [Geminicoccaceae bacterium]
MLAVSSGAMATEPVELNAKQLDQVTAGSLFRADFITTFIDIRKYADFDVRVDVKGTLADAGGRANCFGNNCFAETFTDAYADPFGASADSLSTAGTSGSHRSYKSGR